MAKRTTPNPEAQSSPAPVEAEAKLLSPNDALSQIEEWISSAKPDYSTLKTPVPAVEAVKLLKECRKELKRIRGMEHPTDNAGWKLEVEPLLIKLYGEGSPEIAKVIRPKIGLRILDKSEENQTEISEREIHKQLKVLKRFIKALKRVICQKSVEASRPKEGKPTNASGQVILKIKDGNASCFENPLKLQPAQIRILEQLGAQPQVHILRATVMKIARIRTTKSHLTHIRNEMEGKAAKAGKKKILNWRKIVEHDGDHLVLKYLTKEQIEIS